MVPAARFAESARSLGFRFYASVPCSHLGSLLDHVTASPQLRHVGAANEGDAVALASGSALGGVPAVALLQNSGLGNAVNALTSLSLVARIPVLLVVSWRGDPEGPADEPQHEVMGRVTPGLLDLVGIPWSRLPASESALDGALAHAADHLSRTLTPYAFLVPHGGFTSSARAAPRPLELGPRAEPPPAARWSSPLPARADFLAAVQRAAGPRDVVIATTGYTSRELYALSDRPGQLYCVGALGGASSLGLGLALARPERRVIVLDGDGAALMHLGALATIGCVRPPNLLHVLFDNEAHESTGGQATAARVTDLAAVAHACAYPRVDRVTSPAELADIVAAPQHELRFAHVKVRAGTLPHLPRPGQTPAEGAARLRSFLGPGPA